MCLEPSVPPLNYIICSWKFVICAVKHIPKINWKCWCTSASIETEPPNIIILEVVQNSICTISILIANQSSKLVKWVLNIAWCTPPQGKIPEGLIRLLIFLLVHSWMLCAPHLVPDIEYFARINHIIFNWEQKFGSKFPRDCLKRYLNDGFRKIAPRSGSGFGLRLALELGLGTIFLGGNFPRTLNDNNFP